MHQDSLALRAVLAANQNVVRKAILIIRDLGVDLLENGEAIFQGMDHDVGLPVRWVWKPVRVVPAERHL